MKAVLSLAVVAAAVLATAGCASGTASTPSPAASANVPVPQNVSDPAKPPAAAAAGSASCDPYASLRPSGSLPSPGAMPSKSAMAKIYQRGTLKVGVDQNTFLFGYRDPASGKIIGFDIDIAREVAKAIFGDANKIQLVAITSAQRIPDVRDGTVDMVAETMTVNCDRLKQVDFSTIYYDAGQRVLVPKDSTANSIADLGNRKVCAATGSTSIQNIAAAPSHPIPVSVADWTDCLVMLQQNQVAAISTDDTILEGLAAQDPNTKMVGAPFTDEPYGIAISQDNPDLVRFVNGVLEQIRSNGRWAAIYSQWLQVNAPAPPPVRYKD
jgi:polar amino acid transport system substrate-binding protein